MVSNVIMPTIGVLVFIIIGLSIVLPLLESLAVDAGVESGGPVPGFIAPFFGVMMVVAVLGGTFLFLAKDSDEWDDVMKAMRRMNPVGFMGRLKGRFRW